MVYTYTYICMYRHIHILSIYNLYYPMILQLKNCQNCKRPGEKTTVSSRTAFFLHGQTGWFPPIYFNSDHDSTNGGGGWSTPRSIHRDLLCCRSTTFQKASQQCQKLGKNKNCRQIFCGAVFFWVGKYIYIRFDG